MYLYTCIKDKHDINLVKYFAIVSFLMDSRKYIIIIIMYRRMCPVV